MLVTGGATGIGREICLRLAREGASVCINYRTREADAASLKAEIDALQPAALMHADIRDPGAVSRLVADMAQRGGIHGLVHAASAPLGDQSFRKTDWERFVDHWQVAVHGAYLLVQGLLAEQSAASLESIVFVLSSSTIGTPPVNKSPYVSAKYALLGLARCLAVELAPKGVRVNCVSPSLTPIGLTAGLDERIQDLIRRAIPMRRLCAPEDVAAAVAFLLSRDSAFITGVNLPLSGGAQV